MRKILCRLFGIMLTCFSFGCASFSYKADLQHTDNMTKTHLSNNKINVFLSYTFCELKEIDSTVSEKYPTPPFSQFEETIIDIIKKNQNVSEVEIYNTNSLENQIVKKSTPNDTLNQKTDYTINVEIKKITNQSGGILLTTYPGYFKYTYFFHFDVYDKNKKLIFSTKRNGSMTKWYSYWFVLPYTFPVLIIFNPKSKIKKMHSAIFNNVFEEMQSKNILK